MVKQIASASVAIACAFQTTGTSSQTQWNSITKLRPGSEVTVMAQGISRGTRYLVRTDESTITVLNLASPPLTAAVAKTLRDVAVSHPEYVATVEAGGSVRMERGVSLEPSGVFERGQKLATLQELVETLSRRDVETGLVFVAARERTEQSTGAKAAAGVAIGLGACFLLTPCRALIVCGVFRACD